MSFFDLVRTSVTNLYQRKARTMLTILGVIIGTMSIVLMIALGEGSAQVFMEQVSQSTDLTKIEVYESYSSDPNSKTALNDKTADAFETIPGVRAVLPITQVPIYLKSPQYVAELYISAAPFDRLELLSEKLEWGSIQKSQDMNIYLGAGMTQYNFYKYQPGKDIWEMPQATDVNLETQSFEVYFGGSYFYTSDEPVLGDDVTVPDAMKGRVAGVFAESGSELDYQGYIDLDVVKKLYKDNKKFCDAVGIRDTYNSISVYATDMDAVEGVLAAIKDSGFQAYSPMEYIKQMQDESKRQQAQWGAVGAIALVVSAIGIVNTMMTSIMERKKEIGVLKVLGCSLGNISEMFLIEAAIIGMLGGLIAVGLSYGVQLLTSAVPLSSDGGSFLGSFFGDSVRFVIKPGIAIAGVLGAALIGMIAGIYPSVRAMKMSPLSALRDE